MPSLINPYSKYLSEDEVSPISAEALFEYGRRQGVLEDKTPRVDLQNEQPWHKIAITLLAQGMSQTDICKTLGISHQTIYKILREEWFQAKLALALEKEVEPISSLIKGASISAFLTIKEISEDEKAPQSTRLAAAKEILDRHLGKSTQFVEVKSESKNTNVVEETKALELEANRLRERLNLHDSN